MYIEDLLLYWLSLVWFHQSLSLKQDLLQFVIYLFIMHLVKQEKIHTKTEKETYEIHTDSNVKSISVALKPGIIISLLLTRNRSLITEQHTSDWTATLLCTKFLLI